MAQRPASAATTPPASAPVDVVVHDERPARRVLSIEWDPLSLLYNRLEGRIEISPIDHHVLVVSPFYFNSRTASFEESAQGGAGSPVTVLVPSQRFEGFGAELGYRYYTGLSGPRGFFIGPTLTYAQMQETAGDGTKTPLRDYGIAIDAGYQALVAERWVVSVGLGLGYTLTSRSLADQLWPANTYANGGVLPRPLFAVGYSF
ncbi:MAG: DUF3575 domain-containing protein [Polyangiaceae bacterium]